MLHCAMYRMSAVGSILAHESSVICIRFSPDDCYIASVSKDRSLCISEATASQDGMSCSPFAPVVLNKNAHKRVIWDCSWCGSSLLITCSRDGSCKVWDTSRVFARELICLHEFRPFDGISVTSIDTAPRVLRPNDDVKLENYLVALGSENGDIQLWTISSSEGVNGLDHHQCSQMANIHSHYCHGSSVKRIRWNPSSNPVNTEIEGSGSPTAASPTKFQFASCGDDSCIKIFTINL